MSSFGSSVQSAAFGALSQAKSTFGVAAQSPWLLPVVAAIGAIVLIAIIVVVTLQYTKLSPKAATKGPIDLWAPGSVVFVSRTDTNKYMKGTWTMSFYVRFDAVPDMRSSVPFLVWPGTWTLDYNPAQEMLLWNVNPAPDGSIQTSGQQIEIPRVPMQKWTQITLAQEGRTLDIYVDGALVKSDQLTNLPQSTSGSITIVPNNIMGQAAFINMWSRRLTGTEIGGNYADTSDSQGRPLLGPDFFKAFSGVTLPNIFCPSGNCGGTSPSAQPSQTWEFPYA